MNFDTFCSHYLKYLKISAKAVGIGLGEQKMGKIVVYKSAIDFCVLTLIRQIAKLSEV